MPNLNFHPAGRHFLAIPGPSPGACVLHARAGGEA